MPQGTEIEVKNGKKVVYKLSLTGKLIDDALAEIEKENPKLKNVLSKNYTSLQIAHSSLVGLINLIAKIPFRHNDLDAKDILGHVYEYFLGQFALAEGKKSGQYYTPKSIANLIVEMLEPYKGRVYDPAMGSGGLPAGLFFGTGIPAALLVFRKDKKKRNVIFIDASREFVDANSRSYLGEDHIAKIVKIYKKRKNVDKYAYIAKFAETDEKDFNLNIPRYVDTFEEEEEIDVRTVQKEIDGLEKTKRGKMQQLLTGKTRVKLPKGAV